MPPARRTQGCKKINCVRFINLLDHKFYWTSDPKGNRGKFHAQFTRIIVTNCIYFSVSFKQS